MNAVSCEQCWSIRKLYILLVRLELLLGKLVGRVLCSAIAGANLVIDSDLCPMFESADRLFCKIVAIVIALVLIWIPVSNLIDFLED